MPAIGQLEKALRFGEGRRMKRLAEQAAYIATLEPDFQKLSDAELLAKTAEFRKRFEDGEELENLLFEAFAAVREARVRESDQRIFDVQMMGGIVLHEGDIAEMKTGEGKTFVASLSLYLNALPGTGVHLVTVNDYLAQRDAEWNRGVFERLGMRVSFIESMMSFEDRKAAYDADITYGTNSEFGFDYLRDNMSISLEGVVQRGHAYAIVDEVDSILVDEARTPLIISGEPTTAAKTYYDFARIVKGLDGAQSKGTKLEDEALQQQHDYLYDEKHKTVAPGESGIEKVERALGVENLYSPNNVQLVNHLIQALKAQALYKRDVEYLVQDGEVKIVDEFTGRIMEGRRWSEGLHQAIEAKEGVPIMEEHQTLATITLQNYFRLYEKLGGMTGTAKTEEKEFVEIYGLNVVEIPTNVDVARDDKNDLIFKTVEAKFNAVVDDIKERNEKGQPVLVGTIAVETSEYLSELLKRKGVPHSVLNAKEHAREAEIIKDAGQVGSVTIATNMAGRGVDIKIDDQVRELGGLYVLGTERHEARRIDNQLRGRTGRQGDPGHSKFYLSCEDDLLRIFAGDRLDSIMRTFGVAEGEAITHKWLNKAIATAQKRVEQRNYEIRKNLLKYDDVVNDQRKAVFEQRAEFMAAEDLSAIVEEMRRDAIDEMVLRLLPPKAYADQWDTHGLTFEVKENLGLDLPIEDWAAEEGIGTDEILERVHKAAEARAGEREQLLSSERMRQIERTFLLQMIDAQWREHLMHLDHLKNVIHLRGYGQRDPLNEYKVEAFSLFEKLQGELAVGVTRWLMTVNIEFAPPPPPQPEPGNFFEVHVDPLTGENERQLSFSGDVGLLARPDVAALPEGWQRTGRNALCPCGSGKKFKHCHGALV
jgi:preprotein translocase subunit SecA